MTYLLNHQVAQAPESLIQASGLELECSKVSKSVGESGPLTKLDLQEERGALFKMEIALLQFSGHTLARSLARSLPSTPSFSS